MLRRRVPFAWLSAPRCALVASAWLVAAVPTPALAAAAPTAQFDAAAYERSLADVEARRVQLGDRFAKATTPSERAAIRDRWNAALAAMRLTRR